MTARRGQYFFFLHVCGRSGRLIIVHPGEDGIFLFLRNKEEVGVLQPGSGGCELCWRCVVCVVYSVCVYRRCIGVSRTCSVLYNASPCSVMMVGRWAGGYAHAL